MNEDGQHEDYRAYGEVYLVDGDPYLDVCRERHWYLMDFGVAPRLLRWPAGAAWLD